MLSNLLPVLLGVMLLVSLLAQLLPRLLDAGLLGGELQGGGAGLVGVTALVVAWVSLGVAHLPVEAQVFGWRFGVLRNLVAFVSALCIALFIPAALRDQDPDAAVDDALLRRGLLRRLRALHPRARGPERSGNGPYRTETDMLIPALKHALMITSFVLIGMATAPCLCWRSPGAPLCGSSS